MRPVVSRYVVAKRKPVCNGILGHAQSLRRSKTNTSDHDQWSRGKANTQTSPAPGHPDVKKGVTSFPQYRKPAHVAR